MKKQRKAPSISMSVFILACEREDVTVSIFRSRHLTFSMISSNPSKRTWPARIDPREFRRGEQGEWTFQFFITWELVDINRIIEFTNMDLTLHQILPERIMWEKTSHTMTDGGTDRKSSFFIRLILNERSEKQFSGQKSFFSPMMLMPHSFARVCWA